ncbi:hypothetical protein M9H77_13058 [Catharanthus roseus]|uniref:Uncharacterized protein n=1 Tax=Catharanthus roseus TaxID=4058 RepID=A0ACC0BJ35_CATRO|nr:hypothetical protein M9H77_13058 [Catharanthus roseus]
MECQISSLCLALKEFLHKKENIINAQKNYENYVAFTVVAYNLKIPHLTALVRDHSKDEMRKCPSKRHTGKILQSMIMHIMTKESLGLIRRLNRRVQNNVPFDRLPKEDPNARIGNFPEVCDTFIINKVSNDALHLRLFPLSLRRKEKSWMKSIPSGSIISLDSLAEKFLG